MLSLLSAAVTLLPLSLPGSSHAAFRSWSSTHRPGGYATADERVQRLEIFEANLAKIHAMNADPEDHAFYEAGKFADREPQELPRGRSGARAEGRKDECTDPLHCVWGGACYAGKRFPAFCNGTLPSHLDWSALGAVTPVKDQGDCGNCFTFSVTGNLEGTWFLAGNNLVSLSEQQLTSCDKDGDDGGCSGSATVLDTFKYVVDNKGIALETLYPLCSSNKTCTPAPGCCDKKKDPECKGKLSCKHQKLNGVCNTLEEAHPSVNISGYYQVSGGVKQWGKGLPLPVNETAMMEALIKTGPLSIAVNSERFDNYKKGVMSGKKCKGSLNSLDHEVLLVGFGEEAPDTQTGKALPYWLVKNSWASDWGEKGFVRLQRGGLENPTLNYCGIAADCSSSRP